MNVSVAGINRHVHKENKHELADGSGVLSFCKLELGFLGLINQDVSLQFMLLCTVEFTAGNINCHKTIFS